ncbi:EF-Tu/IF-2/RF-3 family GTPase, partial [Acinetobacter baumannii]
VTSLAYSSYVGVIGTGRIKRGRIKSNSPVAVVGRDGKVRQGRVLQVLGFMGLDKVEVPEATAGDIIAVTGIEELGI